MCSGLTVVPEMWAINSQTGRSLEQVQYVLLRNKRAVVVYEVVCGHERRH